MSYGTKVSEDDGGTKGADERMNVHICKSANATTSARSTAASGIKQALDDLVSFNAIPGWRTTQWDTTYSINCDGDGLLKEWTDWRKNEGMTEPGSWLFVYDCNTSVANSSGQAWENDLSALVKISWAEVCAGTGAFEAVAVQEVLHNFIDSNGCSEAASRMEGTDEHTLGDEKNPSDRSAYRTPMCISYQTAPDGSCNETEPITDCYGEPILNFCEKYAVRDSRDHFYGRH